MGNAKPLESQAEVAPQVETSLPAAESVPQPVEEPQVESPQEMATQPGPATSVSSIEGRAVYDENANKIGIAKQVGIDSTQSMVLVITQNDGTKAVFHGAVSRKWAK